MPDYQKMYTTLFNNITDITQMLKALQQQTEEMFIGDCELKIIPSASQTDLEKQ